MEAFGTVPNTNLKLMAEVEFQYLQKPLDKRLLDAACIYYDVPPEFFKTKRGTEGDVLKKQVFIYLLHTEGQISYNDIKTDYGFGKSTISQSIEKIAAQKNVYRTLNEQIENIKNIAGILQCNLIIKAEIQLQNIQDKNDTQ